MFLDARNPPRNIAGFDPTADVGDAWYDEEKAEKAVAFFPRVLNFTKGVKAGEKFDLEDWQADIVRTIFGWRRPDGSRRFRTVFAILARKNGKTTLLAGLANYVLFCDGEAGAECYCAASSKDQASLLFRTAEWQVRKSIGLEKRCKLLPHNKRIVYQDSFLAAIPANEGASHGFDFPGSPGDRGGGGGGSG